MKFHLRQTLEALIDMSTNDEAPSRRSEQRVPLAEALANLEFQGAKVEATMANVSSTGVSMWIPSDLGLTPGATPIVRVAGDEFSLVVQWIEKDADRGFMIGGDRILDV